MEPARFLREVAGTDQNFRLDEFADTMRSRLVSVFTEALARAGVPALDVAQRFAELGDALLPIINPAMREKYGPEITTFILENVSVPLEVEQAIDKRSSMSLIGSLHDYVKYQMGEAMGQGGEAGAAATGAIRPVRSGAKGSAVQCSAVPELLRHFRVSDGNVAKRCNFCGSPSIIAHQTRNEAITPQNLFPFKISDGQMRESLRKWYGSRWFAPNKLKSAALTNTLARRVPALLDL